MRNLAVRVTTGVGRAPQYCAHDDVIKWKQLPLYWTFVRGRHHDIINNIASFSEPNYDDTSRDPLVHTFDRCDNHPTFLDT